MIFKPTAGINVWCATCGGEFNAGLVITAIKISGIDKYVEHKKVILSQLLVLGVNPKLVKEITGWECIWGPVNMNDLPEFIENLPDSIHNKSEKQRKVRFKTLFRLEIASTLKFPILLIIVASIIIALSFINQ
ncbi:MAG: hypothetical protein ACTSRP_20645 [Candidatus Helarchaeota archaeon]